jgi:multidrug efflux system membrane fusion protein
LAHPPFALFREGPFVLGNAGSAVGDRNAMAQYEQLGHEFSSFSGRVVNLNISPGAFARAGVEVFTLVDTNTWYVMANFRETQLSHIPAGAPVDIFLQSQPARHFRGTVVGLGWAVLPDNGTSVMGLPNVERSLEWIRLATRFPVRIKVEDPNDSFRIGASAVATVSGTLFEGTQ